METNTMENTVSSKVIPKSIYRVRKNTRNEGQRTKFLRNDEILVFLEVM